MTKTEDLGLYLSVPSLHKRPSSRTYSHIVEKVRKKLNSWKANCLSFAGRVSLAQACLFSIPNYILQAAVIPNSTSKYKIPDSSHLLIKAANKDSVLRKGIAKIHIKPPAIADGPDYLAWKFSSNGEFTIKTAYEFLTENSSAKYPVDDIFKTIWSWQGPPRVSTFVWKVVHGKLLTNYERFKRGMTSNNLCPRCNSAPETIMHLLRDCDIVAELWESLIGSNSWASFFSLGQDQWIRKNLELSNHSVAGVNWSFIFPICIWSLWKDRNSPVFKQKTDLPGNLFFHVISYARRTIEVIAGPSPLSQRIFKKEEFVGWSKPPNNFYKLNVDASVILPSLNASCGGLIRDHDGSFIKGFSCNIGLSSTVKVELWGLLHGLNLVASLKISNLIVNVDSLLAV
ncbi:Ribonuclease H-like superfamily [Sesbania bispinosa]|nr:Ribonuclease H-like superfamily [Sesbania bispinosa]